MKILRECLLFCILITLFGGTVADKSPFYDGILAQNQDISQNDNSINYRLPTDVKPISYDILLVTHFEDFTFTGVTKIEAVVKRATNNVTLHVGNIEIELMSVFMDACLDFSTSYENITEKYTITFSEILPKDTQMTISFTYNGVLSDNMIGFYRSSYYENGNIKWLAATQFGMTHARHAFPCFDEPSFKARFTFKIARDKNYKTLSNMRLIKSETLPPGVKIWDHFEQSIPMSTYLVAFVISEFDSVANDDTFAVWSKPSTIDQTLYALKIGIAALDLFSNKFKQNYTLPKMDMVAVPDFAAGAMENWGLVTYRESRMLYDEEESSAIAQQSVASVIVHELTHMWFGNLVTPEWWSYLWLSEAFARYFQYFGTAELEETWNMEEQFVVEQHQSALIADSIESSLPMTREISSKSQIAGVGDSITYNKGASIVRMMNLIFGNEIFEDALHSYIQNNNEKGLGHPDALWEAIKVQIDKREDPKLNIDVKTIMDSWTTKSGYPVITININNIGVLDITQERFLVRNLDETPTNITWFIPLTFVTKSRRDFNNMIPWYWMSTERSTAHFTIRPREWVIFNVQSSGFYRVNYNDLGWDNIIKALENDNLDDIHVLNRASIVDDLFNLCRAGYQKYDLILKGLHYLGTRETNYLPFKAAFNGLEYLNKRFTGQEAHDSFKTYVLSLIDNRHVRLGWEEKENDDRLTVLLRQEVNNWLCKFDDEDCVKCYTNKFKQWKDNVTARIKPNERPTAYCVAIRHGSSEDWEHLWQEYINSNNAADQIVILNALGCTQNTTILERYLKYAISSYETSQIRKQDSTSVFAAVYSSSLLGAEYVLDFVEQYHKEMEEYYGRQSTIATILDGASQYLSTNELVNKFENLMNNHKTDFASIQNSLEYSLRVAKYELEWYTSSKLPELLQNLINDESASRLPKNVKPTNYIISLTPHFEGNFTVGKVTINIDVMQPTNQIILHSTEIKSHNVIVKTNEREINIIQTKFIDRHDFFVIYLEDEITAGTKLIIEIEYTSDLNATGLCGFYKSSYMNEKGETR